MTQICIGVDIAKDTLEAHRLPDGASKAFSNTPKGCKAFLMWAGKDIWRIVFEPTGPYHKAFEKALGQAGLPYAKVNPWQARRFAEATGKRAKTDRIDAPMLARMGLALQLGLTEPKSETLLALKELRLARQALVDELTALSNRSAHWRVPLLLNQARRQMKRIEKDIKAIEAEMRRLGDADPAFAERLERLISIPGIGEVTAWALLIEMPELGSLAPKEAAGLAPVANQSGTLKGQSAIKGGRKAVRDALYMPAHVAARHNPWLKEHYEALLAMGKPPKVAITALMRRLIVLANALLRDNRKWNEKHA